MTKAHGKALGAALVIGLWILVLALPDSGLADLRCERSPEGNVLSISATENTYVEVRRAGSRIGAFRTSRPGAGCKTGATVTNTDRIEVFAELGSAVFIELSKGAFAPGLTPDDDGSSEIEWEISGPGAVELIGGRKRDRFRFMDSGSSSGVNLNAGEDEDLDFVLLPGSGLLAVNGGGGADRIDSLGTPSRSTFAIGGRGDDTLVAASSSGALLRGGPGSDRLIGTPTIDLLIPGRGADLVRAGDGRDEVELSRDGNRDRVVCGGGNDFATSPDRLDHLTSCKK